MVNNLRNYVAQAVAVVQTQRVWEGMLALPYRFLKFGVAGRVDLCEDSTLGRICKSAPTVFLNLMACSGYVRIMTLLADAETGKNITQ